MGERQYHERREGNFAKGNFAKGRRLGVSRKIPVCGLGFASPTQQQRRVSSVDEHVQYDNARALAMLTHFFLDTAFFHHSDEIRPYHIRQILRDFEGGVSATPNRTVVFDFIRHLGQACLHHCIHDILRVTDLPERKVVYFIHQKHEAYPRTTLHCPKPYFEYNRIHGLIRSTNK